MLDGTAFDGTAFDGTVFDGTVFDGTALRAGDAAVPSVLIMVITPSGDAPG